MSVATHRSRPPTGRPRRTGLVAALALSTLGAGAAFAVTSVTSADAAERDWRTLTATSADALVETVAVNIHSNYGDTVYADQDRTLRLLKGLGIRHVRDGVKSDNPSMHAALRRLRDNGIRASLIIDPDGRFGAGTLAQQVEALKDPERLAGVPATLEGINEPDCGGEWVARTRAGQAAVAKALAAEPALRDIPLLGPSWCRGIGSMKTYGNDGDMSDTWNIHPYAGGYMPEAEAGDGLGLGQGQTITGQMEVGRAIEDQPFYATEAGYHNAVAGDGDGHNPTSEAASGPYIARMALEYHRVGVKRTFYYELQNQRPEPSLKDREQHFGLVRYDGSLKPSYLSLQSLLTTLADPGAPVADRKVEIGLSDAPGDLRTMAFARRDGSTDLAMWRAASLWDVQAKKDLSVPEVEIGVSTRGATTASVVRTSDSKGRSSLGTGTTFTVPVGGSPVIVRLGGSGSPGPSADPSGSAAPSPSASADPSGSADPTAGPTMPAGASFLRIDVGSSTGTASGGSRWNPDRGFTGGTAGKARRPVSSTLYKNVHQTYRYGMSGYTVAVPSGTYQVRVLLAEDAFTEPGRRVFSISAEGEVVAADIDLFREVGLSKPTGRVFTTTVTDGTLDLGFTAKADRPIVSGIEIMRVGW